MSRFRVITREAKRVEKVTHKPLAPPRGLKYVGGVLSWKAPQDTRNITHFRVYRDNEFTLIRELPFGQTELNDRLTAERVFVSSYNTSTGAESRKVLLSATTQIINGERAAVIFGIPGTVAVEDDTTPHVEISVGDGKVFRCLRAYVNAKDEPTSLLKIDCEWAAFSFTAAYEDRVWSNIFPTTGGDLSLTVGQMQREDPVTTFFAEPMELEDRVLVRCNVKRGDGGDVVAQIVGVIRPSG